MVYSLHFQDGRRREVTLHGLQGDVSVSDLITMLKTRPEYTYLNIRLCFVEFLTLTQTVEEVANVISVFAQATMKNANLLRITIVVVHPGSRSTTNSSSSGSSEDDERAYWQHVVAMHLLKQHDRKRKTRKIWR